VANPSKQKGTSFESAVRDFLAEHGFPTVERRTLYGAQDKGDLSGIAGWTFECKNEKKMDIAGAVDEARIEAKNAKTIWFAAIVKRKGKNAAEAYAVMPLSELALIIAEHPHSLGGGHGVIGSNYDRLRAVGNRKVR
jgi:hypothetical protein